MQKRRYIRGCRGFTMVELLISLVLFGVLIALAVNAYNFTLPVKQNIASHLLSDCSTIEMAFVSYNNDKNTYPTGMTDSSFVPVYLHAPIAPEGFDTAYGKSGYTLAKQTGQASPNNGWYICTKVTVDNSDDPKWQAMSIIDEKVSKDKFFYGSACPALSNASAPSSPTTIYPTIWLTRY
jgi:prepilin-type N-terminal cleavage/methylation domain-containing protein